jgi:hypothetical protein
VCIVVVRRLSYVGVVVVVVVLEVEEVGVVVDLLSKIKNHSNLV